VVEVSRGDVVIITLPGDYGKRRAGVVVESDLFAADFASVLICPVTTEPLAHSVARIPVAPSPANGLTVTSSVMVDKLTAIPRARIFRTIGRLDEPTLQQLDAALALMLGIS